ncbi:MAG TPA: hypothetical protein PKZ47_09045, partial [Alistipes sp.]|uniref:hypothetical protein n=1 Tax=Alistipes sp. TaxID=1872444 RepID=UPI002B782D7E
MSTLHKTTVFYTDANHKYRGPRHALIEHENGIFCNVRLANGSMVEAFVPSQELDCGRTTILTIQLGGEIFYRTGKTGTNKDGMPVQEMASYKADGTESGARLWIDTEMGENVWQAMNTSHINTAIIRIKKELNLDTLTKNQIDALHNENTAFDFIDSLGLHDDARADV